MAVNIEDLKNRLVYYYNSNDELKNISSISSSRNSDKDKLLLSLVVLRFLNDLKTYLNAEIDRVVDLIKNPTTCTKAPVQGGVGNLINIINEFGGFVYGDTGAGREHVVRLDIAILLANITTLVRQGHCSASRNQYGGAKIVKRIARRTVKGTAKGTAKGTVKGTAKGTTVK